MTTRESQNNLVGLQYVRAFAVILVVLDHINIVIGLDKYIGLRLVDVENVYFGAIGVNIFFVLSGFIMVYISVHPHTLTPRISVRDFFLRRVERIIPFLWGCIAVYAALRFMAREGEMDWLAYIRAALFYPYGTVNPTQAWTLRYEMLFYAVFSAWIAFPRVGRYMVFLWFFSPFLTMFLHASEGGYWGDFFFTPINFLFGIGAAVGVIYKKRAWTMERTAPVVAVIGALSIGLNVLYERLTYSVYEIGPVVISGLVSAGIIALAVSLRNASEPNFVLKQLARIGDASYAIYLTHGIVLSGLAGAFARYAGGVALPLIYFVMLAAVLFGGYVIHVFLELPVISFARSLSDRTRKRDAIRAA